MQRSGAHRDVRLSFPCGTKGPGGIQRLVPAEKERVPSSSSLPIFEEEWVLFWVQNSHLSPILTAGLTCLPGVATLALAHRISQDWCFGKAPKPLGTRQSSKQGPPLAPFLAWNSKPKSTPNISALSSAASGCPSAAAQPKPDRKIDQQSSFQSSLLGLFLVTMKHGPQAEDDTARA